MIARDGKRSLITHIGNIVKRKVKKRQREGVKGKGRVQLNSWIDLSDRRKTIHEWHELHEMSSKWPPITAPRRMA